MKWGLLCIAFGLILTVASYLSAAISGGGKYLIAWGIVAVGVWLVLKSLAEKQQLKKIPEHPPEFHNEQQQLEYYLNLEQNGPRHRRAEALFNIGLIYQKSGNLKESQRYYEQMLNEGFIFPELCQLLASIYQMYGQDKKASELLQISKRLR